LGRHRRRQGLGALDRSNKRKELLRSVLVLTRARDVDAGRHPNRGPICRRVVAGLSEESYVLNSVWMIRGDRPESEREHRIMSDLAGRQEVEPIIESRRTKVLLIPAGFESLL
jgi:hypothetical protein